MAKHRRANFSGQDSEIYLHLKEIGQSFKESNRHILDRKDKRFERGVKEAILVKVEKPSLHRRGGQQHHLSPTYKTVFSTPLGNLATIHKWPHVTPTILPYVVSTARKTEKPSDINAFVDIPG